MELFYQRLIQGLLKVKAELFEVENLVLLYKSKWKGLYKVRKVLGNGIYELETIDQKVLKDLINGEGLKLYHESFPNDFGRKPP